MYSCSCEGQAAVGPSIMPTPELQQGDPLAEPAWPVYSVFPSAPWSLSGQKYCAQLGQKQNFKDFYTCAVI